MRELQSLEISKVVFFDGLTKDTLFNIINAVHNSIEIARMKTGQLGIRFCPLRRTKQMITTI